MSDDDDNPLNDPFWLNCSRLIIFSILPIVGICGLFGLIPLVLNDLASQKWPATNMTVTQIVREKSTGRRPRDIIYMDFQFMVDGQTFEKKRHLASEFTLSNDLDSYIRDNAVGTQHPVYYDPQSPGTDPQIVRGGNIVTHVVGIIVCIVAVLWCPVQAWWSWQVVCIQYQGGVRPRKKKRQGPRRK